MSTTPPLPPPPQPPPPSSVPTSCYLKGEQLSLENAMQEVRKAIALELGAVDVSGIAFVRPLLQPLSQLGPVCGIISLAEAAGLMGLDDLDPDLLLAKAIQSGRSRMGEMFSAKRMGDMIDWANVQLLHLLETEGAEEELVRHLKNGEIALIPYDADFDHRPCCRRGHSAHWAVLHGVVFLQKGCGGEGIRIINSGDAEAMKAIQAQESSTLEIYVIAHHGKSLRTAIWKLSNLLTSNGNLIEVTPKILEGRDEVEMELCSRVLLLKSSSSEL